jgi:hypothetical protein
MFIPDPNFPSWIRIRIKELSIFNPKHCFKALGNMIWDITDPDLDFYSSLILDPCVKKAPDPGSVTLAITTELRDIPG